MSNRTISSEKEMQERWKRLSAAMEKENIDALLMYSTDRTFSAYLRYITDCPTVMYPMAGLFCKDGISLVGHGVRGIPLYPVPPEEMKKGQYQFHAGGVRQHKFIRDMIGAPACPTTTYAKDMWPSILADLIRKYGFRRIGLVGTGIIPMAYTDYIRTHLPDVELVDATEMVDREKCRKSDYEIAQAERVVWIIDELMAAAPSVMKTGENIREIGRKLRALADGYDCLDLNVMIGRHPSMPMFSDWQFTDEDILTEEDAVELMIEVSSDTGMWGECARVFCMGEPSEKLTEMVRLAFEMQNYLASMVVPGADPAAIFRSYCDRLAEKGFPEEKRFCCHGQGFDVVEMPFIRPESHVPINENAFIAVHPSMYDREKGVGCFVCDNYLVTKGSVRRMNRTPQSIIRVCG